MENDSLGAIMSERDFRYTNRRPDYRSHRRRGQGDGQSNLVVQLGAALSALWKLVFGRSKSRLNQTQLLADFVQIEALLTSGDSIHAAQAVVRADSFLDGIMQQVGGQGTSFADRLRSLESRFERTFYQGIWDAHKLRNDLAHNHGGSVDTYRARTALQTFRRAASALGAF